MNCLTGKQASNMFEFAPWAVQAKRERRSGDAADS